MDPTVGEAEAVTRATACHQGRVMEDTARALTAARALTTREDTAAMVNLRQVEDVPLQSQTCCRYL